MMNIKEMNNEMIITVLISLTCNTKR